MANLARHLPGTGLTVLCFTLACVLDLELLNMLEICMNGNAPFIFVKFCLQGSHAGPFKVDDDGQ